MVLVNPLEIFMPAPSPPGSPPAPSGAWREPQGSVIISYPNEDSHKSKNNLVKKDNNPDLVSLWSCKTSGTKIVSNGVDL